ncbi:alpha/beta hydrolase [Sphingobacteriaceae bacterium]|nr:alpha/beta hydrolase [Sphingobacteriaceae bacterium]
MTITRHSYFKNKPAANSWLKLWVDRLEKMNEKLYSGFQISTSLGTTQVYGLNLDREDLEPLVLFPGARTSALFFDLDNGLKILEDQFRIYFIETNGLPNLSDGNTPDIKSSGYGEWASEVLETLSISKAFVAGASFGGLICMKLGIVAPEKVKAAFLFNPGCLQPFSLTSKNLYYNILPIFAPTEKNVLTFLEKAVLFKPNHWLSEERLKLLVDYEVYVLRNYRDNTQKPYYMNEELRKVKCATYLIEGDKDLLFPYQQSIKNAKEKISTLKEVSILENVGHGIETLPAAMQLLKQKINEYLKDTGAV